MRALYRASILLLSNDEYTPATTTISAKGAMAISSFRRSLRFAKKLIIGCASREVDRQSWTNEKTLCSRDELFESAVAKRCSFGLADISLVPTAWPESYPIQLVPRKGKPRSLKRMVNVELFGGHCQK